MAPSLRSERETRPYTNPRELAGWIGHRQATIARWERGDRLPSYDDVQSCVISVEAPSPPEPDAWMTAREAATYLGFASVHPLHKLTAERAIRSHRRSRMPALFKRSDLDDWRQSGGLHSVASDPVPQR